MDGDRIERALGRIEAALSRIEATAARPAADLNELRIRHEHLRTAVTSSLHQLDRLIGGQVQ